MMNLDDINWWESRIGTKIRNPNEFADGVRDCRDGYNQRQGMGEDYNRGYCAQYTHEQNMNFISQSRYK